MGAIGPFTFSFGRFFFAFLTVIPFAIYLEQQNIVKILSDRKKVYLLFGYRFFSFWWYGFQQYALQKSLISNAAFLSTLYVPFVGIISRFIIKKQVHWIIWIAILLCLYGSYLLSSNQSVEIQQSDHANFISAFVFCLTYYLIDIFMKELNSSPFIWKYSIFYCFYFIYDLSFYLGRAKLKKYAN